MPPGRPPEVHEGRHDLLLPLPSPLPRIQPDLLVEGHPVEGGHLEQCQVSQTPLVSAVQGTAGAARE